MAGCVALSLPITGHAESPFLQQVSEIAPVRIKSLGQTLFADFGAAGFGNLKLEFSGEPPAANLLVRLGEKLDASGAIDRNPPGSVNYREIPLATQSGQRVYRLDIPSKPFHLGKEPVKMPAHIGEVTPFRYIEIEGHDLSPDSVSLRQLFVHAPFDDKASSFACSDEGLNAVWKLCKHTLNATTAFGVYIDGERERIPYEGDAYINMLSHFACDLDPQVARATMDRLLEFPTWPTEWSLHMPMIAAGDYLYTGDPGPARRHIAALRSKLLSEKARGDGLLVASAIVDWPAGERDNYHNGVTDPGMPKQAGPLVNTVANAFYYHALGRMAFLECALGNETEARRLETTAETLRETFNRVFFDPRRGLYVDGEGSDHASFHANFFALAFGLVPDERVPGLADFLESRGMACSVYGAQYLLEALFAAGRENGAVRLMTSQGPRSWRRMIDAGSTMTWEAWGPEFKKNLTWNHAWGTAPANIISRFVLGVRPLKPGFSKILVAPRPGQLSWATGKVPTRHGPVEVRIDNGTSFRLNLETPPGVEVVVDLPVRENRQLLVNGLPVEATAKGTGLTMDLSPGRHVIESR